MYCLLAVPFLASTVFAAAFPQTLGCKAENYTALYGSHLSPGASIHLPSEGDYNTTTVQRYSRWDEPTFAATIKPATEADIQAIVKISNDHNLPFFATGGGHGSEPGFATVKNGINIDLSNFKQNDLNVTANTLTIGPGISFVDFEENLYKAGKLMPVGNIFCVNMIGASIGATVGPFQGLVGLAIDYLRSVRLVTAAGDLVTASETQNPDLFWAIRGAGANFGIITSASFRVSDAPNKGNLVGANFRFPPAANVSLFKVIQSMDKDYPAEMGFNFFGGYDQKTQQATLTVALSYFGPYSAAKRIIDKFVALGPTVWENSTIPWSSLSKTQAFGMSGPAGCTPGIWNNHYTIGALKTDAVTYTAAFAKFVDFAKTRPWYNGILGVQRFNTTATLAVPKQHWGVYPGRDINTFVIIDNYYDGPQHDEEVYRFSEPLRNDFVKTSGYPKLNTYINYAFGDEGPEVWYGEKNLPRLIDLKQTWDPNGRLGPGNPVPLTHAS